MSRLVVPPFVTPAKHLETVRAVLGDLGQRATATSYSAAVIRGLPVVDLPARARVIVPRSQSHLVHPLADLVRVDLAAGERGLRGPDWLPVVLEPRLFHELARDLPLDEAVAVIDAVAHKRWSDLQEWRLEAAQWSGPYSGAARRALALADHRAGSVLESLGRVALTLGGVGPITPQVCILPGGHPHDLGIGAGARLLVELDGDLHRERARFEADLDDGIVAVDEGYLLVRAGWRHVRQRRNVWVAHIARLAERQRKINRRFPPP